jgi:hypothetical protein
VPDRCPVHQRPGLRQQPLRPALHRLRLPL